MQYGGRDSCHKTGKMPFLSQSPRRVTYVTVITGGVLDVVGKTLGRTVQDRLQKLANKMLPESQCGFRKGRSFTDMVFMVRRLTEKAIEHDTMQCFIFVDLRKA